MAHAIKHFLQFNDLSVDELQYLFSRTALIKEKFKRYDPHHVLSDRTLVMIFEKASTRTRLSFEAGINWAVLQFISTLEIRNWVAESRLKTRAK
jgi:ornithine carbamoyltransferase